MTKAGNQPDSLPSRPARSDALWRAFFWFSAAFNTVVGVLAIASPDATPDSRIIGLLVVCFGIIYALVARDPQRFAPALWAGLIGKFGVVGLLGPEAFGPAGDPILAAIISVDAISATLFLIYLLFVDGKDQGEQP